MKLSNRIALVTGGNRGIGAATARGLAAQGATVLVGARRPGSAEAVVNEIRAAGGRAEELALDVDDDASVAAAARRVEAEHGALHILVNNAAILEDHEHTVESCPMEVFDRTMRTNVRGPFLVTKAFLPLLRTAGWGRIVNLTSGLGLMTEGMSGGYPAYRISKAAINALTANLASEVAAAGILVNSVDPGWVRTDMGGENAPTSVEDGADTVLYAAMLPDDGLTGKVLHERKVVDF